MDVGEDVSKFSASGATSASVVCAVCPYHVWRDSTSAQLASAPHHDVTGMFQRVSALLLWMLLLLLVCLLQRGERARSHAAA